MGTQHAIGEKVIFAVVLFAALAGCSFTDSKEEAQKLADQYYAKLQGEDSEGTLSLYSRRFFAVTARAEWLKFLQEQRARCGTPQTHRLVTWKVFSSIGSDSGTRTTLVYDVQYSNCRQLETLTIFKPSGGTIQIEGHFVKPKPGSVDDKGESPATLKT